MTKENEVRFLNMFKDLYSNFPKGEITDPDRPDFIITNPNTKIGIEFTEVFQDSHLGSSRLQELSSVRDSFTNDLIKKLEEFVSFGFSINIEFSSTNHLKKSNLEEILKRAFIASVNPALALQDGQDVLIDNFKKLPKEIEEIHIQRFDGEFAFNERAEGGGVSHLSDLHISTILETKDEKLKKYESCEKYWLVIAEGNYYAGTFNKILVNIPVKSDFDKVFLLRDGKHQLIELK